MTIRQSELRAEALAEARGYDEPPFAVKGVLLRTGKAREFACTGNTSGKPPLNTTFAPLYAPSVGKARFRHVGSQPHLMTRLNYMRQGHLSNVCLGKTARLADEKLHIRRRRRIGEEQYVLVR